MWQSYASIVLIFAVLIFCFWIKFVVEKFIETIIKNYMWVSI